MVSQAKITRQRLRGGSLSATYLISRDGQRSVRKEVSLTENREFGFQRWCSQLKRLQRYQVLFPGLFPRLLDWGHEAEMAWFDIEYIEGSVTAHSFLHETTDVVAIERFATELFRLLSVLHASRQPAAVGGMGLYLREECQQRLLTCRAESPLFAAFLRHDTLVLNGQTVPSLNSQIDDFYAAFRVYEDPVETFTHGNLTLENILYVPDQNRVVLIDPYEENIIDSPLCEYSQLRQSSHARYELLCGAEVVISGNEVTCRASSSPGLDHFDQLLTRHLARTCYASELQIIDLLEVSQFVRMLPFKQATDPSRMLLFYALASKLFSDIQARHDHR